MSLESKNQILKYQLSKSWDQQSCPLSGGFFGKTCSEGYNACISSSIIFGTIWRRWQWEAQTHRHQRAFFSWCACIGRRVKAVASCCEVSKRASVYVYVYVWLNTSNVYANIYVYVKVTIKYIYIFYYLFCIVFMACLNFSGLHVVDCQRHWCQWIGWTGFKGGLVRTSVYK